MKRLIVFFLIALILAWNVAPAHAEMGDALAMMGEGIIDLPTSLIKVVGGALQFVGEILLFPFRLFRGDSDG